jgi:hypothetical protein
MPAMAIPADAVENATSTSRPLTAESATVNIATIDPD